MHTVQLTLDQIAALDLQAEADAYMVMEEILAFQLPILEQQIKQCMCQKLFHTHEHDQDKCNMKQSDDDVYCWFDGDVTKCYFYHQSLEVINVMLSIAA